MITDTATPAPPTLTRPAAPPNAQVGRPSIDYAIALAQVPSVRAIRIRRTHIGSSDSRAARAADRGVQGVSIDTGQHPTDRGLVRCPDHPGQRLRPDAQRQQHIRWSVGSPFPIAARDFAPASTAHTATASTPARSWRSPRRSRGSGNAAR